MHADCYFATGRSHTVCEDYARAGEFDGRPFAILADGCSSSPDTDVGARFLVLAAQSHLMQNGGWPETSPRVVIERAFGMAWQAGLRVACLDATLLALYAGPGGNVSGIVTGDGVVVGRRRDGLGLDVWDVRYEDGAPAYLSYLLNPIRRTDYIQQGHGWRTIEGIASGPTQAFAGHVAHSLWFDRDAYDLVAIISDGVHSFVREVSPKRYEPVPIADVLAECMAVKAPAGEFVKRRCQRFLRQTCSERKWEHRDDFSMAAIWMGDAP